MPLSNFRAIIERKERSHLSQKNTLRTLNEAPVTTVKPSDKADTPPQECVGHDDPDKENKRPKTRLKESRQVIKTKGPKVQTGREVRVKKEHVLGHMLNPVPNVIVVQGRWWSKNVFRNAWLAGLSRDDAWTEAFVS